MIALIRLWVNYYLMWLTELVMLHGLVPPDGLYVLEGDPHAAIELQRLIEENACT